MKKLAFGALFVGLLVACGNSPKKPIKIVDAPGSDGSSICNPLAQTGCQASEMCTWIIDMDDPNFAAHIGCAPAGTIQTGGQCTRNPPGPTGYDNCAKGNFCFGPNAGGMGTCKLICDLQGGSPMCPTKFGCVGYQEIFSLPSDTGPPAAGVCEPTCDPLNDNNFLGSAGTKTGSACGTRGCYGLPPDFSSSTPTVFTCAGIANPTRIHRSACTGTMQAGDAAACLYMNKYIYPNSCSAGYQPLINDSEGSMQQDCIAMCGATDCTGTGTGLPGCVGSAFAGVVPHTCYDGSIGTPKNIAVDPAATGYTPANANNDGEQCNYMWNLEFDASGMFVRSATSDTLGLCINRGLYYYDSNGDGMVKAATDTVFPACNKITNLHSGSAGAAGSCPGTYPAGTVCCFENGCLGADGTPANTVYGPFACVSATTAGAFSGKQTEAPKHRFPMLRLPYNRTMLHGID
jgi:hypothetical protein